MHEVKSQERRRHDAQFKAEVLAECAKPGASVAKVALAHGLNTNLVHKWRRDAARGEGPVAIRAQPMFVPLPMATPAAAPAEDIRVELRKGAVSLSVRWPLSASQACAQWLRDLLQ